MPFYTKMIILPRQARNRHRESTRKRGAFCVSQVAAVDNDVIAHEVTKRSFLAIYIPKCWILPRHARDKHRESWKERPFCCRRESRLTLTESSARFMAAPAPWTTGWGKRLFWSLFLLNMIILPRQARDKHRKSGEKRDQCVLCTKLFDDNRIENFQVRKRAFWAIYI